MTLSDFRTRLQEITGNLNLREHPSAINALKSDYPHTIQLVGHAKPKVRSNCYEWALRLDLRLTSWVAEFGLPDLFAGNKFVSRLVQNLSPISIEAATAGDLILYFNGQMPTHAGLVKNSQIISKWGEGHIYKHGFLEVPANYGDTFKFYSKVSSEWSNNAFKDFVRNHPDFRAIKELFKDKCKELYQS